MLQLRQIDVGQLVMKNGVLSMAKSSGQGSKNSAELDGHRELLEAVAGILGPQYGKIMASNKKYIDPERQSYFELVIEPGAVKLTERSSLRKQQYVIDFERRIVLFNGEEVAAGFGSDVAQRLRLYATHLGSDPKVSVIGIKK
ncbi:hypothetical protein EBR96_04120 [bacterium]|nr:hypothetical protein [bacterium]